MSFSLQHGPVLGTCFLFFLVLLDPTKAGSTEDPSWAHLPARALRDSCGDCFGLRNESCFSLIRFRRGLIAAVTLRSSDPHLMLWGLADAGTFPGALSLRKAVRMCVWLCPLSAFQIPHVFQRHLLYFELL